MPVLAAALHFLQGSEHVCIRHLQTYTGGFDVECLCGSSVRLPKPQALDLYPCLPTVSPPVDG